MLWNKVNIAEIVEQVANGEKIEALVFEGHYVDEKFKIPVKKQNKILSWEEARPYLDHKRMNDYGTPCAPFFTAWTASKIIYIHEYDGLVGVCWHPKNPTINPYLDEAKREDRNWAREWRKREKEMEKHENTFDKEDKEE